MRRIDADALLKDIQGTVLECEKWIDRAEDENKPRAESAFAAFTECALRVKNAPTVAPDEFTIDELRAWLYEMAFNNIPSEFEKHVVEIIQRLDGFERFCKDRRGGDAHE